MSGGIYCSGLMTHDSWPEYYGIQEDEMGNTEGKAELIVAKKCYGCHWERPREFCGKVKVICGKVKVRGYRLPYISIAIKEKLRLR